MATAKPYKREGVWYFSDGTAIPDQRRADADARYRDSSNNLHILLVHNCGNRDVPASVTEVREQIGWDAAEIEVLIDSLAVKLDMNFADEVVPDFDEAVTAPRPGFIYHGARTHALVPGRSGSGRAVIQTQRILEYAV